MFHNKFKQKDPVAEAIAQIAEADYKAKMEALKGDQHKIDKNKNNKIDAHDFAILRGEKKSVKEEEQLDELSSKTRASYANKARASADSNRMMADLSREAGDKEGAKKYDDKAKKREAGYNKIANPIKKHFGMKVEGEQVEEGWDDMMKAAKERRGPQPSGGSGKKAGSRYGGSNQKKEPVKEEEQLDEISTQTLKSYKDKVVGGAQDSGRKPKDYMGQYKQASNRATGVERAVDRLNARLNKEGWDDMMKAAKERRGPQPSGGSGKKAGSRYGGSNQKSGDEDKRKVDEKLEPSVKSHDGLKGPAPGVSPNKMRSNKVKFVPEESINEGLNDDDHYIYHPDTKKVVKRIPASSAKVPFGTNAADHPSIKPHLDQVNAQHGPGHKVAKGMKLKDIIGESVEQIDELSKKTLGDYVKKASHDVAHKGALTRKYAMDSDAAKEKQDYVGARKSMEKSDKTFAKSWKRREGMAKAVDRLTKEDVEQVDERELTKGETKEKERIVKGMKKSFAGFRARYGDRAKSVMYATATKAAKDD